MSWPVECYCLVYTRSRHPPFNSVVGAGGGVYVSKYVFARLSTLAHKPGCFGRDVEVLLYARFLLSEYYSGKVPLFMYVAPRQAQHIATSQSCKTWEQERCLDLRIFAFGFGEFPDLVDSEVHSGAFLCFEVLYATHGVEVYQPIVKRLVKTGS